MNACNDGAQDFRECAKRIGQEICVRRCRGRLAVPPIAKHKHRSSPWTVCCSAERHALNVFGDRSIKDPHIPQTLRHSTQISKYLGNRQPTVQTLRLDARCIVTHHFFLHTTGSLALARHTQTWRDKWINGQGRCIQGNHTEDTHKGDLCFAFDFKLRPGTKVCFFGPGCGLRPSCSLSFCFYCISSFFEFLRPDVYHHYSRRPSSSTCKNTGAQDSYMVALCTFPIGSGLF